MSELVVFSEQVGKSILWNDSECWKEKQLLNDHIEWAPAILSTEGDSVLMENFLCDHVIKKCITV